MMILELALRFWRPLLLLGLLLGGYFFWQQHLVQTEYNRVVALYEKRDAETLKAAEKLLEKRKAENEVILEEQRNRYMGAIESYAEHIEVINATAVADAGKRLYARTNPRGSCGDALPGEAGNPQKLNPGDRGFYQAELAEEVTGAIRANAREVAIGAASCQKLIDILGD